MTTDHPTLRRTPYAAGWDGETYFSDDTEADAIGRAMEDHAEHVGLGEVDPAESVTVTVYVGCRRGTGPDESIEDSECACEGGHEDFDVGHWLLLSWDSTHDTEETP